jgi:hypothetical protein
MLHSLNTWGNFGILGINKNMFNIQGDTILESLEKP